MPFSDLYVSLGGSRFERDGARDYRFDNGSVRIGYDHRLTDRVLIGGALSAAAGEVDDARLTYDTLSFAADLYATALFGPAYVTLSGGIAHHDYEDLDRRTLVSTVTNRGTDTNGVSANVGIEAGYGFQAGAFTITPALGLDYLYSDADGYAESGAAAEIVYGDTQRNALLGSANLHLGYVTDLGGRPLALTGRIGYEDILTEDDARVSAAIAGGITRARSSALDVWRRAVSWRASASMRASPVACRSQAATRSHELGYRHQPYRRGRPEVSLLECRGRPQTAVPSLMRLRSEKRGIA